MKLIHESLICSVKAHRKDIPFGELPGGRQKIVFVLGNGEVGTFGVVHEQIPRSF